MSNPFEIIGTVFGLLSVWLTVRKSIWCWPTGLINIVLFFVMFYRVKLYAELITYSVFFVLGIYGWWEWAYGGENRSELPVTRTPRRLSLVLMALALIWAPAQGYAFRHYTDAALPYWDSMITVLSLIAQWTMARKYLENWVLWIAVDVLGIGVYWYKGLHVTAALYLVFLIMAACGLVVWWRGLKGEGHTALLQRELGVIVGKFCPPHRGHKHVIDFASQQVRRLVVIVCSRPDEAIPGELRAAWIREMHPGVEVMRIDDVYDPDDSAVWAANTTRWLGRAPDVAFTSEDYGPRWAGLMGSQHVMVDRERATVPCSGRDIRAYPLDNLHFVEPCVRAFLVPHIVVLGAESSGTTTLARALATHYRTACVPEYGREYCETLEDLFTHEWRTEEFMEIAGEQNRREDLAAREADPVLICDTDSFATGVWHHRYMGRRSVEVEALSAGRRCSHHFLTDVDIPFVQDGLRDGEAIRTWMHGLFVERLNETGRPFTVVSGDLEERVEGAVALIDDILASLRF